MKKYLLFNFPAVSPSWPQFAHELTALLKEYKIINATACGDCIIYILESNRKRVK